MESPPVGRATHGEDSIMGTEWLSGWVVLGMAALAPCWAHDESGAEVAKLRARVTELESENRSLRHEVARLKSDLDNVPGGKSEKARLATDVRLLHYLDKALDEKPNDINVRLDAAALATRLAPDLPGHLLVWQALLKTETLKDGMSLRDAEKLLGPPTEKCDEYVGWYFNPRNRHVAPYLHARVMKNRLAGWKLTSR
jgi:outer membrane murein-binding lipoprotein Lpp